MMRLFGWLRRLREALWLVPALCVALGTALSFLASWADSEGKFALFNGGPDGARAVLTTIASSMMTFIGVVFSVTMLVLQLASNQFSPRVMRTFLKDRASQWVLGLFIGTFSYCLMTLRTVWASGVSREVRVPALSVWLAIVLATACVLSFVFFIHHVAQAIRAVNVLQRIGDETRAQLHTLYPEALGEDVPVEALPTLGPDVRVVTSGERGGVLTGVGEDELWEEVQRAGASVCLLPYVGDFVAPGRPLFAVLSQQRAVNEEALRGAVALEPERNVEQDASFGLRQLVDVAERALSPGINDPTTAVQAIDQLHDVLMRLVRRRFPSAVREKDGARLVLPRPGWDSYVHLAVDEIRRSGSRSMQVVRRLRRMLEDLLAAAPPSRQPVLRRELDLLAVTSAPHFEGLDAEAAAVPSAQGHGPLRGL